MIRNILKSVKSNLTQENFIFRLNEKSLRMFSNSTGEQDGQANTKGGDGPLSVGSKGNQGKNQKNFDNKRNFQNNNSDNIDKNNDKSKKSFTPFKQQRKEGEFQQQQQQPFKSESQSQQSYGGFQSGATQRSFKKEVIQFNNINKQSDSPIDGSQSQYNTENRQRQFRQQRQFDSDQNTKYPFKGSSGFGQEQENDTYNFFKSEQIKNEKLKNTSQHQQLMKRIKEYEQNGKPNEQDLRSAIECYNSCGIYDKAISTYKSLKQNHPNIKLNETILNTVLESHIKNPNTKQNEINEFFNAEFVQPKLLKLIYKDNIQNYISRVSSDDTISSSQRIKYLSKFSNHFTYLEGSESQSIFSFNNIDLSSLSSLFKDTNTEQYIEASKVLAALMNLCASAHKGPPSQFGKNVTDSSRIQHENINIKKIFKNLLDLKEYETCKKMVLALSKGNLLHSHVFQNRSNEQLTHKYIDYQDLINFCIQSQQSIKFWIEVVAKNVDFEPFTTLLSNAVLELKMHVNPPQVFSQEKLNEFFYKISSYGALSPSQVYTLMEISIYLKEYGLAIELYQNHQKYTNRRRDTFVYEKMIQVINTINLRYIGGKLSKDAALQGFRKLSNEAEQQTGKPINLMVSKIHEVKSHIIDHSLESAFNLFNDRFLKETIVSYQSLRMKYFLLLLVEKQEEKGELQNSEFNISKFLSSLAPKQIIQLWSDERNDSYLVKQLANKDDYNEFVKRVEVEKYLQIIKRDINNGFYTIQDRRNNMDNVYLNPYERYVIENFEDIDPGYTIDNKLKQSVLDGVLKMRKYEEIFQKREERQKEKRAKKQADGESSKGEEISEQGTTATQRYEKGMEDSQIEINKILGRPMDTPVNIAELYKKYDIEDKFDNKQVEKYVSYLKSAEYNKTKSYKMKFMNIDDYKDAVQAFPDLYKQATALVRPSLPAEYNLIFDLIIWGADNQQPLAIQLGEIYCDLNGIPIPTPLTEKINNAIDPYNDKPEYLEQFVIAKKLIGDINRERIYQSYTHFSQKPQYVEIVNKLAENDKYRDEAGYILQFEIAASRLNKYGISKKQIMEHIQKEEK